MNFIEWLINLFFGGGDSSPGPQRVPGHYRRRPGSGGRGPRSVPVSGYKRRR